METIYHHHADHSICDRSGLRLLCVLHLFHVYLLSVDAKFRYLWRRGVCGIRRHGDPDIVLGLILGFLCCHVQESTYKRKGKAKRSGHERFGGDERREGTYSSGDQKKIQRIWTAELEEWDQSLEKEWKC